MTIWVLHQALKPEEEERIHERTHVVLPFGDVPDLSGLSSAEQCRKMFRTLYPDDAPETLTRRVDKLWPHYSGLQKEDIIAVPLKTSKRVALAEVTGKYSYDGAGPDKHLMSVTWYPNLTAMRWFGTHKDLFVVRSERMFEVTLSEARIAIRDKLPHSYNRFAKWKWIAVVFFILAVINMIRKIG